MRIGLVSPYDFATPGGANHHILQLASQLQLLGHSVKIIGPASRPPTDMAGVEFIECGKPYPVPANASIARISISLRLAGPVKQILDREAFDVIHLHEPLQGSLPLMVLRHANAVKVGTFHAFSDSRMSTGSIAYYYGQRILKRWFRLLDGKIAVSEAAAEYVGQFFPGYYNVIPNGIEFRRFADPKPAIEQFADGKLNVLFLGRLEQRKGVKFLLRAFRLVREAAPNTRLIIAGAYSDRQRIAYEHWADQSGVPDIHFVGRVSHDDLARYYQTADVFCAPNTGDESFGIVLLEAMAAGRPIVASNIRGFAAVMTDGVEGVMVPPKDVEALAAAILRLLADPVLRTELGANGRIKAREYSWDRLARRIVSYYERILFEVEGGGVPVPRPARGRLRSLVAPIARGLRR